MARLTPEKILKLSEPVELVYQQIVDALLLNIAKHFNTGKALTTQEWQLKKLAEMGQLNKENLQIIASMTGQVPELIQIALERAAIDATQDMEPELKEAAKKGILEKASSDTVLTSKSIQQSLSAYTQQAMDKCNLVNTVMLESTLNQYRKVIANTVRFEQQLQTVQKILNTAAGKVVTGAFSRTQALRDALIQISNEGLTGFVDKAGKRWSPEAYVNMDVRTTVHNTAIETVKLRQEDYGTDIFRVSRHSGARPLCYPYQGRYFSWSNKSGTFRDGEGKQHRYYPISSTSYGKPAGLFGINCGHDPITVIPGVSIPRDRTPQDKKENDRIYAESQKQRYLEREVRYVKRDAAMLEAAGDKEGFEMTALKVKQKQANYNAFCKETGRTKRLDRTQVLEYNKIVSNKAKTVTNKYDKINHHTDGTIIVTDSWTNKKHVSLPKQFKPNAVLDTISQNGKQRDRMIYDANGRQKTQINSAGHGNLKQHPFGEHGEHAHDIIWEDGKIVSRIPRELTEQERKENADIL